MDEKPTVTIPVKLLRLGDREVIIAALAAGVIMTTSYQLGKRAQRRWIDKIIVASQTREKTEE